MKVPFFPNRAMKKCGENRTQRIVIATFDELTRKNN